MFHAGARNKTEDELMPLPSDPKAFIASCQIYPHAQLEQHRGRAFETVASERGAFSLLFWKWTKKRNLLLVLLKAAVYTKKVTQLAESIDVLFA